MALINQDGNRETILIPPTAFVTNLISFYTVIREHWLVVVIRDKKINQRRRRS